MTSSHEALGGKTPALLVLRPALMRARPGARARPGPRRVISNWNSNTAGALCHCPATFRSLPSWLHTLFSLCRFCSLPFGTLPFWTSAIWRSTVLDLFLPLFTLYRLGFLPLFLTIESGSAAAGGRRGRCTQMRHGPPEASTAIATSSVPLATASRFDGSRAGLSAQPEFRAHLFLHVQPTESTSVGPGSRNSGATDASQG